MKIFGLKNIGSICYLNSLIQSLISCEPFTKLIAEADPDKNVSEVFKVMKYFLDHIIMDDVKAVESAVPILREIMNSYEFYGHQQEDVGEGFDILIELLGDSVSNLFMSKWTVNIFCGSCKGVVSTATDTMNRITMEKDYIPYSRSHGVDKFVSGHMSRFSDYRCPKCKCSAANGVKVSRLIKPPRVLVVSFNKFNEKWMSDPIEPTMSVNYGEKGIQKAKYRLMSVIHHSGNMTRGHYTNTAVRGDKTVLFNDSRFVEKPFEQHINDYVLFYSRY